MSEPHYEARREVYVLSDVNIKPGLGQWRYYRDGVEITLDEYTDAMRAARTPIRITDALAAKVREALPTVPVFVHGATESTLRDAIASHLRHPYDYGDGRALVEHLLESPELEAIRKFLHEEAGCRGCFSLAEGLADMGLPASVAAWVLEGEQ